MAHLLHDYIAGQLARHLSERRVVVWFDARSEFEPFVHELCETTVDKVVSVSVGGVDAGIARYGGSLYALRSLVEPLVAVDELEPLLVYVPGITSSEESPLKELELGGKTWNPSLRQLAGIALREKFTAGVIDDLLAPEQLRYEDIAAAVSGNDGGSEPPSMLKMLLGGLNSESQLAGWLADASLDGVIAEKEAASELGKLVLSRLGLELPGDDLGKWRAVVARFVLAVEFRSDLAGDTPKELESVPAATKDVVGRARTIAQHLRDEHADRYADLADRAEKELGLTSSSIDPLTLGSIDTFRFEEQALLDRCGELVRAGEYEQAATVTRDRRTSFWLTNDVDRRAQWEAIELAASLGSTTNQVAADLNSPPKAPAAWIEAYSQRWQHLDRAQRKLEAWLPNLEHDPDERAIAAVRARYDEVVDHLTKGYVGALESAAWEVHGVRRQTSVFDDLVRPHAGPVALFLVDAMRYEMGAELHERLQVCGESTIEPAVGVLPSITPTGMAALMPRASATYDVVADGAKLAARVDGGILKDLNARKSHVKARESSSIDMELGEVLQLNSTKLSKRVEGKDLVVVRSQEIDLFGEGGHAYMARGVMDTVIDNLARAVRKLAAAGVGRAVIASDHGHLFAGEPRPESMRIESPGGDQIDLHRRCWAGRGGATPPGCVRVAARDLGNDAVFDFVFPRGTGVFKAGGDLAFHHGGPSLQEMVIPVITFRAYATKKAGAPAAELAVSDVPAVITNRMFTAKLSYASLLASDTPVRPVLLSDGRQVGSMVMVVGADEQPDGSVILAPGTEVGIGFMLQNDDAPHLRVVVLDPATDAELYRSPSDIPIELGVG